LHFPFSELVSQPTFLVRTGTKGWDGYGIGGEDSHGKSIWHPISFSMQEVLPLEFNLLVVAIEIEDLV